MSLTQIFTKIKEKGILSSSFYKVSKAPLPKADKDITQKFSAKLNPTRYYKDNPLWQRVFILGMQAYFDILKSINIVHYLNRIKKNKHLIKHKKGIWHNSAPVQVKAFSSKGEMGFNWVNKGETIREKIN